MFLIFYSFFSTIKSNDYVCEVFYGQTANDAPGVGIGTTHDLVECFECHLDFRYPHVYFYPRF